MSHASQSGGVGYGDHPRFRGDRACYSGVEVNTMATLRLPVGLPAREAAEAYEDAEDRWELRELHAAVWQTRTHAAIWDEARELRLARLEAVK